MIIMIAIFLLSFGYYFFKGKTAEIHTEERTQKIATKLSRLVMLSPIVGVVIFTILFTTLLRGRFLDRSSHAFLVFVLWMLATSFYIEVLKHYKNKNLIIIGALGTFMTVFFAVLLTPLDRYSSIIHSNRFVLTYILAVLVLFFLYKGQLQPKIDSSSL